MNGSKLLDALPAAVYVTDAEGHITYFNEAAAELWGHRPKLGTDQWCGSWRIYGPDGRVLPHDECPMAIALKEERPVRGVEAIAERPDGTRIRFLPYPTPLRDASGKLVGAINLLADITERHQADIDLERLAAIVDSSDDAIVSKTLDGQITSWNAGATRIFGYQAHEMIGQPITRIIPPELHGEEAEILARLRRGERVDHFETVRIAKDGRRLNISLTVSPVRDKLGNIVGAAKIARDVTERKQAEKLQRLLMDELTHRVKNTLATVQAMANQSLRRAKSPADFVSSFGGRVQALARAHDLITQAKLRGAEILDIVRDQVLLGATDDVRVSCSGPVVMLDAEASLHLALVLHELATNARKYGALSSPNGRLSVQWELQTNCGYRLVLEWRESGGPKVSAPKERGFGSALIEHTLAARGGEVSMRYAAAGVTGRIVLPIPEPDRSEHSAAPSRTKETLALLSRPAKESCLAGKRVLIIEDEPLVAMDLQSTLATAGCEVVGPVGTLDKARAFIADAVLDAALLDVNLSGHKVDELATALTRTNVPFAFVSGYGRESLPSGFHEAMLLKKPFSQEQLIGMVESLLYQADAIVRLRPKTV